jgi:hypothetical protein
MASWSSQLSFLPLLPPGCGLFRSIREFAKLRESVPGGTEKSHRAKRLRADERQFAKSRLFSAAIATSVCREYR